MNSDNRSPWVALISLLATAMLYILLVIPFVPEDSNRVFRAWWDFAHVPVFALIVWLVLRFSSSLVFFRTMSLWLWILIVLSVPLVEFVQVFTGREQALIDVIYGWAGCLVGVLVFIGIESSGMRLVISCTAAALIFVATLIHPLKLWREDRRVEGLYPVLSAFDSPLEVLRWKISGCEVIHSPDGWVVTITDRSEYPGLFLLEGRKNWSQISGLTIELFLQGDLPLEMWIRMDDLPDNPAYFDRFQKPVTLRPGTNSIHLSRQALSVTSGGRAMNLERIYAFGVFFNRMDAGRVIRLTRIRHVPAAD